MEGTPPPAQWLSCKTSLSVSSSPSFAVCLRWWMSWFVYINADRIEYPRSTLPENLHSTIPFARQNYR